MKRVYMTPSFEVEHFQLDSSIASNCAIVVHNGPAVGSHKQCSDYEDPFGMSGADASIQSGPYNVWFYEDTNCDCYYSASDSGYWTS